MLRSPFTPGCVGTTGASFKVSIRSSEDTPKALMQALHPPPLSKCCRNPLLPGPFQAHEAPLSWTWLDSGLSFRGTRPDHMM